MQRTHMTSSARLGTWSRVVLVGLSGLWLTACAAPQAPGPMGLRPADDRLFAAGEIQVAEVHLRDFGYDPGPVDGIYTAETQAAVRAYQRRYGLPVSGLLDQPTRQKLLPGLDPEDQDDSMRP
jgi:peptidoglycan hydrolase-like protein with peptidoglycan-binding domain